jgi:Acyl carrier protein phosphodiesterase
MGNGLFSLYLQKRQIRMKKLVVIDACIRGEESRTRRIAEPVIEALAKRYEITRFDLTQMPMEPLTPQTYADRAAGKVPAWALDAARQIAEADRIVVAAPFWDMSFPAVVKVFFEHTSLFDITFTDNGRTCVGKCKCEKVMYITTRGMNIPTGDAREQGTSYLQALSQLWDLGIVLTVAAWNMDYASPEEIEDKIESATRFGLRLAETF